MHRHLRLKCNAGTSRQKLYARGYQWDIPGFSVAYIRHNEYHVRSSRLKLAET